MKVQVWVEIPDDCEVTSDATLESAAWEHAANEIPKHGRMVFSVRIRERWQWPSWLKNFVAVTQEGDGRWFAWRNREPAITSNGWSGPSFVSLKDFDFTPPPCTDWRQSLRLNPNREVKS